MNDLISRQAAIDVMGSMLRRKFGIGGDLAEITLAGLPSAQPERKMGKWERHYCEDGNPDGWRCDKCDEWYYFGQTLPNFCPNCGADMRGDKDDESRSNSNAQTDTRARGMGATDKSSGI